MKAVLALSSLILLSAASLPADDYIIKMHQPLKAGQRYKLTAAGSDSTAEFLSSGPESAKRQTEEIKVEMESVVTVLAVNANGLPKKESHTIVKFLHGTKKTPLIPAGTKVVTSLSGKKTLFEVGGRPANIAENKHLSLVAQLSSDGPTDDDIYGSRARKKTGESWPINSTLATRYLDSTLAPAGLKVASLSGKTIFQKVLQDGGTNVFHMRIDLKATANPLVKVPRTTASATIEAELNCACPADITKSAREDELKLNISFKAFSPPDTNGVIKQLSTKSARSVSRKFELLEQDN